MSWIAVGYPRHVEHASSFNRGDIGESEERLMAQCDTSHHQLLALVMKLMESVFELT